MCGLHSQRVAGLPCRSAHLLLFGEVCLRWGAQAYPRAARRIMVNETRCEIGCLYLDRELASQRRAKAPSSPHAEEPTECALWACVFSAGFQGTLMWQLSPIHHNCSFLFMGGGRGGHRKVPWMWRGRVLCRDTREIGKSTKLMPGGKRSGLANPAWVVCQRRAELCCEIKEFLGVADSVHLLKHVLLCEGGFPRAGSSDLRRKTCLRRAVLRLLCQQ